MPTTYVRDKKSVEEPGGCPRIGCPTAATANWSKNPLFSANSPAIYLTKPNFYPQFSVVLATGAILGQPPGAQKR